MAKMFYFLMFFNQILLAQIYGRDDAAPSPLEATKFEEALTTRGVPHNITIYEGGIYQDS